MVCLNIQGEQAEISDEAHLLELLRRMEAEAMPKVVAGSQRYKKPDLEGAVVVVSGAAQGIGRAVATGIAHQGIEGLVLLDINQSALDETASSLNNVGPRVLTYPVDLTNEETVERSFQGAAVEFGKVTHSVSNAAILISGPLLEFGYDNLMRVLAVNTGGHYNFVRSSVRYMLDTNSGGTIAQVTSKSALKGSGGNYAYPASKAACHTINQGVVLEHGQRIRVNAAAFGNFLYSPLWTDPERGLFAQYSHNQGGSMVDMFMKYAAQTADGRFCEYVDASRAIIFLLSRESAFLQGQTLRCDHGYTHW